MPELVGLAGGVNLFGEAGKHVAVDDLGATASQRDPDVIVVMPCGFDLARTRARLPALHEASRSGRDCEAVRNGRVFVTDGNQFFNRPGPRLVESLEILAEILHPNHFHYGHEGLGWQRL